MTNSLPTPCNGWNNGKIWIDKWLNYSIFFSGWALATFFYVFCKVRDNFGKLFSKAYISEPAISLSTIISKTSAKDKNKTVPERICWKFLANVVFSEIRLDIWWPASYVLKICRHLTTYPLLQWSFSILKWSPVVKIESAEVFWLSKLFGC